MEVKDNMSEETTPISIEEIEENVKNEINTSLKPRNRAERRAMRKKVGAKNFDSFTTAAKKMAYINLIQKLREKNKENEENEGTQD